MHSPRSSSRRNSTSSRRRRVSPEQGSSFLQPSANRRQSEEDRITEIPPTVTAPFAPSEAATKDDTSTLPTKTEALIEGGKPGRQFGLFGKTNYGKLIETIDQFHKTNESNKAAQVQKLVEIQSLMSRWLENPDRVKEKEGDRAKENFIGRIRPIIKVKYYELETKSKVFDPINSNAAKYAELNKNLIHEELLKEKLRSGQKFVDALLNKVKEAPLTVNFPPEVLKFFLKGAKDWKNTFQTRYKDMSPGGNLQAPEELGGAEQREDGERYLGYSPFTEEQRENRPAYAAVNVLDHPRGAAKSYGHCYFVLNENVKKRTTYTAFDTFEMRKNSRLKGMEREKTIATQDNIEAALAYNKRILPALVKKVEGQELSTQELKDPFYIEAVIHGGFSLDDVAELVVCYREDTPEIRQQYGQEYVDEFSQKHPNIKIKYKFEK
jgi:Protein of unknown function (DUF3626)